MRLSPGNRLRKSGGGRPEKSRDAAAESLRHIVRNIQRALSRSCRALLAEATLMDRGLSGLPFSGTLVICGPGGCTHERRPYRQRILLRAPRSRVWQALSDTEAFGQWVGVELTGTFAPEPAFGERLRIRVTSMFPRDHYRADGTGTAPSWRWHPHAIDPNADYSASQRLW